MIPGLRLLVGALMLVSACGCTRHVQDPWVSGDQYAAERNRSPAQEEELRQRLFRVQQDR
jgi:hypothetical protein